MTGRRRFLLTLPFLGLMTWWGCDSTPGVDDPLARPPEVLNLGLSPRVVQIDNLPSAARVGDDVVLNVDISADARDADGDLSEVRYVVQFPVGGDALHEGVLVKSAGSQYAASEQILFPTALTGAYPVVVWAVDQRGYIGNELRGAIELALSGQPPVIVDIEMPERVQRPAAGQPAVPIQIVAIVNDPDGLANVARVEVRFDGGSPFLLCDDGGQDACNPGFASGDAVAGDGRFTLTIQIDANNTPGPRSLDFLAIDRSGQESERVTRTLIIE